MKLKTETWYVFKKKPIFLYWRPHKFQISLCLNVFKVFFCATFNLHNHNSTYASTFLFLFALLEFSMIVKLFQHVQLLCTVFENMCPM